MKLAVAITGASGAIYARRLLDKLAGLSGQVTEVGLVWSSNAPTVWEYELGNAGHRQYGFRTWANNDFMAPFASGSSSYAALIICPCSMGTIGRIASGISADVMLKERRKLICVVRETPYNLIHLKNMTAVTEAGGIICPATPSFYSRPGTLEEAVDTVVNRALQLAGVALEGYRWQEDQTEV